MRLLLLRFLPKGRGDFAPGPARGDSRLKGAGIFSRRRGAGTGDTGFAGGECTPHFLFETSKRKCAVHGGKEKMFRGESVFWVPGKSLPAAWVVREFGGLGHSLLLFSLPLPGSAGAAAEGLGEQALLQPPAMTARICTRGTPIQRTRTARAGRWRIGGSSLGQPPHLSELAPCAQVQRKAFFSFGPSTARFLFGKSEKKMGGGIPISLWARPDPGEIASNL